DFLLAASKGRKHASHTLVLQHVPQADVTQPLLGITVTKKHGNAPVRSRIKRKLRAAFAEVAGDRPLPGGHYVIIARQDAYAAPLSKLTQDLRYCLRKVTQ